MKEKKIVGYCRVSTSEQKKKGFGLDVQIKEIKRFAKQQGITIDRIFKDEAVSGLKESRAELNVLRDLCQKGEVQAVIFSSTDRTARSLLIAENLYHELIAHNVDLYFLDLPKHDPKNYDDIMFRQFKGAMAERERSAIVDKLKKGREERARKGKTPGGTVPYGYRRKRKAWTPHVGESGIVRLIFDLAKSGKKPVYIANNLNKQGFRRRNKKEWTGRQVAEILRRRKLYQEGVFHYGQATGQNKKLIILKDD